MLEAEQPGVQGLPWEGLGEVASRLRQEGRLGGEAGPVGAVADEG